MLPAGFSISLKMALGTLACLVVTGIVTTSVFQKQQRLDLTDQLVQGKQRVVEQRTESILRSLAEAEVALSEGDLQLAEHALRQARDLDRGGDHTEAVTQLTLRWKVAQQELKNAELRRQAIEGFAAAIEGVQAAIAGESTLEQLREQYETLAQQRSGLEAMPLSQDEQSQLAGWDKQVQDLQDRIARLEVEKRIHAQFWQALQEKKLKSAAASMMEIEKFGFEPEELEKMRGALKQAQDTLAAQLREIEIELREITGGKTQTYSKEAIDYLEKVLEQNPDNDYLKEKLKQFMALPRQLRVPADLTTLDEAIAALDGPGKILVGEGVFHVTAKIEHAITIVGQGVDKTILESSQQEAAALHLAAPTGTVVLESLSIRGTERSTAEERHSLLLCEGEVQLKDCRVTRSIGHGIAVLGGRTVLRDVTVDENSWDGVTVKAGVAQLQDCTVQFNGLHGVDFWQGSSGTVHRSEVKENSGSGVVAIGPMTRVTVAESQASGNRECGIYIATNATVLLQQSQFSDNQFSGVAVHSADNHVTLTAVDASKNQEYGYLIIEGATLVHEQPLAGTDNRLGLVMKKAAR